MFTSKNTSSRGSSGPPTLDENDRLWLLCSTPFLLPLIVAALPRWRNSVVAWLIDKKILLPEDRSWITVPGVDAGVDGPRVIIAIAVVVVIISSVVSALRAWIRHVRFKRLNSGDRL